MRTINRQAKTSLVSICCIVAGGLSIAFATSTFAQVAQSTQVEVTHREGKNGNGNGEIKACVDSDIKRYVSNLSNSKLIDVEFEALVKCGEKAVPFLSQALKNERPEVRIASAYALGIIGSKAEAAVPFLTKTFQDKNSEVRVFSAYALGQIGSNATHTKLKLADQLVLVLKKGFQDESSDVRATVLCALGYIGSSKVIETLMLGIEDKDSSVRTSAIYALGYVLTTWRRGESEHFNIKPTISLFSTLLKDSKADKISQYYASKALIETKILLSEGITFLDLLKKSGKLSEIEDSINPALFKQNRTFFFNSHIIDANPKDIIRNIKKNNRTPLICTLRLVRIILPRCL